VPEQVRFHFDPLCPWCYVTSLWVHRLVELGEVEVDWALFSLELANAEDEALREQKGHARSGPALRTAVVVRDTSGPAASAGSTPPSAVGCTSSARRSTTTP
jgi:predicted DsbA family dithiol-disulfide isomerase